MFASGQGIRIIWQGVVMYQLKVYFQHSPRRTREELRTTDIRPDIRSKVKLHAFFISLLGIGEQVYNSPYCRGNCIRLSLEKKLDGS
jgi:hypothetical protein